MRAAALQRPAPAAPRPRSRAAARCAAATAPPAAATALHDWLSARGVRSPLVELAEDGCVRTLRAVSAGEVLLELPEALAVTSADVVAHPLAGPLAEGRGELVGLALWLLAERAAGEKSKWAPFLASLPRTTLSPMLWPAEERARLLRGASVAAAAEERAAALAAEWAALAPLLAAQPQRYPPAVWSERAFGDALATVLACAPPLPAAACFALLPLASSVARRAAGPGEAPGALFGPAPEGSPSALLDYDPGLSSVVLLASRPLPPRARVVAEDAAARGSGELLLAGGCGAAELAMPFPGDSLPWPASLLASDRLFEAKRLALEAEGLAAADQVFPLTAYAMPTQLLAYMRMQRITDAAELARVRFDADSPVSQLNEYEVLQLMLAEARERLAGYGGGAEEAAEAAQAAGPRAAAAAQLRLNEQAVLNQTVAALRARLAPIRASPGKGGRMRADHSDIREIFEQLENIQSAPRDIINGFLGWGEKDATKKDGCG